MESDGNTQFDGGRILLTGASRGVGFAAARVLDENDASVLAVALDQDRLTGATATSPSTDRERSPVPASTSPCRHAFARRLPCGAGVRRLRHCDPQRRRHASPDRRPHGRTRRIRCRNETLLMPWVQTGRFFKDGEEISW
jgi:hypothetical protein